jgi:ketosteroid isomerase-like protein
MNWKARNKKENESAMSIKENSQIVLDAFKAIEQRDDETFRALLHSEFEIHWPPSLPYGGSNAPTWSETWEPLQPTEVERKMDARVIASGGEEVVVLWRQRGVSTLGDRFDGEVLGLYQLRNGKLARAQMFYFDAAAVARFLTKA